MLAELERNPEHWDISSLLMIVSSGVMWSEPVKQGLLRHHPGMLLVDAFSSSEALGMGQSISSAGGAAKTGFRNGTGPRTILIRLISAAVHRITSARYCRPTLFSPARARFGRRCATAT